MEKVVIGTFAEERQAEEAVNRLVQAGFSKNDISIISKERQQTQAGSGQRQDNMSDGVSMGAGIGVGAGLLASAGMLAIPGIGPLLAAGPLAAALSGAVVGGLAGGLIDWGIPADRAQAYEQRVKEGHILATVKTDEQQVGQVQRVFQETGAQDVETHDANR